VPRRMLPISISFDHRILDGAEVARFTNHVIERLESPASFNWESL
jgi:pyruvate dehydrogenase E2 component (dihydrolipoamide acetyltransferase)